MKRLLKLLVEKYSVEYSMKKSTPRKKLSNLIFLQLKKQTYISKIYFLLIILKLLQFGLNLSLSKKECFHFQMKSQSNEITMKMKEQEINM